MSMGTPAIILVDKPKGITSFDVVARIRKKLGVKKVGHAGTLDPLATGLLILGIGEGTKKLTAYFKLPKTYEAQILIGESRTTGDMEGEIVEQKAVGNLQRTEIEKALQSMVGGIELPVSAYSALKRGAEPLYKKARRGEYVELPIRAMEVRAVELLGFKTQEGKGIIKARFDVGSGTYIRSLAEELGRRLGFPATLWNLRRTRIGDFRVEDARQLEDL